MDEFGELGSDFRGTKTKSIKMGVIREKRVDQFKIPRCVMLIASLRLSNKKNFTITWILQLCGSGVCCMEKSLTCI